MIFGHLEKEEIEIIKENAKEGIAQVLSILLFIAIYAAVVIVAYLYW